MSYSAESLGYGGGAAIEKPPDTLLLAIKHVFESPEGEEVLMWLRHQCHFVRSTYHSDETVMHMNEGKRLVYLAIYEFLQREDGELIESIKQRAIMRSSQTQ